MMSDHVELFGLGVSISHAPLTEWQRLALERGFSERQVRAAADLAIRARISANGTHGPAADAAVLWGAGYAPVGSIQSPDFASAAEGLAQI